MAFTRTIALFLLLAGGAQSAGAAELAASKLLGAPVLRERGEPVGKIAALLLDARPKRGHLVLLETPRGERLAYPVKSLERSGEELRLAAGAQGWRWADSGDKGTARYVDGAALLGRAAEDPLGNRVGVLEDVVVSLDSGITRYVLVDFSGDDAGALPLAAHLVRLRPGRNPVVTGDPHRRA